MYSKIPVANEDVLTKGPALSYQERCLSLAQISQRFPKFCDIALLPEAVLCSLTGMLEIKTQKMWE